MCGIVVSSEMFDWNDEELANIIWGEAGENDDHIVPYSEASDDYCNKKEWSQESHTIKPTEQKTLGAKIDLHGRKLESSSNFDTIEGISTSEFGMDSWPDLSLSDGAKTEQHCIAETIQLDKDGENFQNSNEAKRQGDLVDFGWANIGSFDDLDPIFSNDDSIFGHASLGNADELWSSSRDATTSPIKAFPVSSNSPSFTSGALSNVSENLEIKTEYSQKDDESITPGDGKTNYSAAHGLRNAHVILDHVEYAGGKRSKPMAKEQTDLDTGKSTLTNSYLSAENSSTPNEIANKVSRQRKILRGCRKLEEKSEEKSLQDFYGTWPSSRIRSGHSENQLACFMVQSSPSELSQKRQLQGPESFPYQHISNQYVAQSMYGNLTNPNHTTHVPSHIQPGEFRHQHFFSSYEISPGRAKAINKSADTSVKPLTMTPQEKIEKLRRRQQLQAMLAIQKQQQQFNHQICSTNHSTTQKCPQENKIQHFEKADLEVEGFSTLPSLDPNSSAEQDDSNMVSAAVDDYSTEFTILYRLQNIISKLDIKIRLCIRDCLFRLAESAMQRHYAIDTSSSNKTSKDEDEVVAKEDTNSHNRHGRMLDVETETNPIDRIMAHLLFHKPLDLSEKHSDAPESPVSSKLTCEHKAGLVNMSNECLPDSLKNKQCFPRQGSANYCPLGEPHSLDLFKNSPLMENSENASSNVLTHGGAMKAEGSL